MVRGRLCLSGCSLLSISSVASFPSALWTFFQKTDRFRAALSLQYTERGLDSRPRQPPPSPVSLTRWGSSGRRNLHGHVPVLPGPGPPRSSLARPGTHPRSHKLGLSKESLKEQGESARSRWRPSRWVCPWWPAGGASLSRSCCGDRDGRDARLCVGGRDIRGPGGAEGPLPPAVQLRGGQMGRQGGFLGEASCVPMQAP